MEVQIFMKNVDSVNFYHKFYDAIMKRCPLYRSHLDHRGVVSFYKPSLHLICKQSRYSYENTVSINHKPRNVYCVHLIYGTSVINLPYIKERPFNLCHNESSGTKNKTLVASLVVMS